jgi:hypothetical protein
VLYYHLKQVDYNGDHSFSKVISLGSETTKGMDIQAINPNPFTEHLHITVSNVQDGNLEIAVFDMGGKMLYTQSRQVSQGNQSINLSTLSNLPEGVYILGVTNGNETIRQKLVEVK